MKLTLKQHIAQAEANGWKRVDPDDEASYWVSEEDGTIINNPEKLPSYCEDGTRHIWRQVSYRNGTVTMRCRECGLEEDFSTE